MKILIAQSYFRILDSKQYNYNQPFPPLGAIILATELSKEYSIKFYDSMLSDNVDELYNLIESKEIDVLILYDDEFNYLTKMSLLNMRNNTFKILAYAKSQNIPTIVYTSDAIDNPKLYLQQSASFVVTGEGEVVVAQILNELEQQSPSFDQIAGLAYMDQDKYHSLPRAPLRSNLDELPIPDYERFVDMQAYRSYWNEQHGYFSLNISTSRGCTYGCNWCSKPLWGRTYNAHSPQRIAEVFQQMEQFGVDIIWITDDIFGLKKDWLKQFAEEYSKRNLSIKYKCLSRADLLVKGKTLEYLAQTNCEIIWIGAESGSQKVLDAMEKGTRVEQIHSATTKAKSLGIKIAYFIQFGYLGETWEDILMTRELIKQNDPDDIGISVSYPLPGTKFFNTVQDQLTEKKNWVDADDLDMLFHGTYSKDFYRTLHGVVHNEYRYNKFLKNKNYVKASYHRLQYSRYLRKLKPLKVEQKYQFGMLNNGNE